METERRREKNTFRQWGISNSKVLVLYHYFINAETLNLLHTLHSRAQNEHMNVGHNIANTTREHEFNLITSNILHCWYFE